jgi:hypothetical protein
MAAISRHSGNIALAATDTSSASPSGIIARLRGLLDSTNEASITRRLAGAIFVIRVVSAGLAYLAQVLLARWMGGSDYGVYVYVWTWVLLLGSMMDFGISASAQKLIPEYRARKRARAAARLSVRQPLAHLRRFLHDLAAARGTGKTAVAVDGCEHGRAVLHRLPDVAAFRGRQHPGRNRPFA